MSGIRVFLITLAAMLAFAGNSILTRLALIESEIGAGSFAFLRLFSGALFLALLATRTGRAVKGHWRGGLALMIYAVFFSYAYISLPAGTGAVILFAVVQFTMIGWGLWQGERLQPLQIGGAALSALCLIWLVSPGIAAPSLSGSLAMILAGIGWGVYSIFGRGADDPIAVTTGNFIRASVLAGACLVPIFVFLRPDPVPNQQGLLLAIGSGVITSGLGYIIWYTVLPHLSTIRASVAQLSVPALAAIGGVVFLSEPISLRFTLATLGILGGVALAVLTLSDYSRKADK